MPLTCVDPGVDATKRKAGKCSKSGCNETPANITYANKCSACVFAYYEWEYDQFYTMLFYSAM